MARSNFSEWMVSLSCAQFSSMWCFCSNSFLTSHSALWGRRCLLTPPAVIDWGIVRREVQMCEKETPSFARVVFPAFCCLLQCSLSGPSHSFSDSSYYWVGGFKKNTTNEDLELMVRGAKNFSQWVPQKVCVAWSKRAYINEKKKNHF